MASDVTGDVLRGLGIPLLLTADHIWTAESSFTEQTPTPGVAVPQQASTLRLETSGTQSAGGALRIQTHRAGNPGPGGAGYIWKNEADTDWRGRDIQQIVGTEAVAFVDGSASTYSAADEPDCCALPDGTVFAVFQATLRAGSVRQLIVAERSPTADTWSLTVIGTANVTTIGDGFHPAIAYNPVDGHVYVFAWTYDIGASLANVRTYRGTLSGGSWSWATASKYALQTPVSISGSPGSGISGYEVSRLRAGFAQGQCLLLAHAIANNTDNRRDTVLQFASVDRGMRFATVSGTGISGASYFDPDVVVIDDAFYAVCWCGTTDVNPYISLQWVRLPHAYASLLARTVEAGTIGPSSPSGSAIGIQPGLTSNAIDNHSAAAWVDEDGTVMVAFRDGDNTSAAYNNIVMIMSQDRGVTWRWMSDGVRAGTYINGTIFDLPHNASTLIGLAGCSAQGRQVLLHQTINNTTTYDNSVRATYLGGSTTVTLPGTVTLAEPFQRQRWDQTYLGQVEPSTITGFTYTSTGTPGNVVEEEGWLVQTSAETAYITEGFTAAVADGFLFMFAYTPNSGGSLTVPERGVILTLADGTDDYEVSIRITTTQIRVVDTNGATTLATSGTLSGAQEVMVALQADTVSVWYRAWSNTHDREWTLLVDAGTVTSDTATPAASPTYQIGHIASGTADTHWRSWMLMADAVGGDMAAGQTNPDDLYARDYPRRGRSTYVSDGVRISALDGAGVEGEEYDIDADAEFPIERVLYPSSPDSRVLWKSTAVSAGSSVAAQEIAVRFNPNESGSTLVPGELEGDLIFVYLKGVNFGVFDLEYATGSGATPTWTSWGTIDTRVRCDDADLRNGTITIPSSGTNTNGDKVYLSANECQGWTGQIGSPTATDATYISGGFRVLSNSGGFLDLHTGVRPRFRVTAAPLGGGLITGTQTLYLVPDEVCVLINTGGQTLRGIKLSIASGTMYGNAAQIGRILIGHVMPFGTEYSRGRQIEFLPGTITEDTPDGVRRYIETDPGRRSLRIAWTDGIDQNDLWTGAAPDYLTASSVAGNEPLIAERDTPVALQETLRFLGAGLPVVYLPRIPRSTGSGTEIIIFNRRADMLAGTVDSSVQIESVTGDENSGSTADLTGEVFRTGTITIREMT